MTKAYRSAFINASHPRISGIVGVIAFVSWGIPQASMAGEHATAASACRVPDLSEVHVAGGTFLMGSQEHAEEGPVRRVTVQSFSIDRFDVTNAEFARFVTGTGYVTDAERAPDPKEYPEIPPSQLRPGGAVFEPRLDGHAALQELDWWRFVPGANWRHPQGPESSIIGRDNDPVVQVSYRDALAYARWRGRKLPTEEQYEYAARGGLDGRTYSWGNEMKPGGRWMANVWQGTFPQQNGAEDGYARIAPVGCFPPNGYGLYDMTGNVWKWTSSLYERNSTSDVPPSRVRRTLKGGSFLCSTDYCMRFRPSARQPQESGFSSVHMGFRTVGNGS